MALARSLPLDSSVEDRLGLLNYRVDHGQAHIEVRDLELCKKCGEKWCVKLCPAKVYEPAPDGGIVFNYENCVECGAAPYICPYGNIEWRPPRGGFGVQYRFG